MKEKNRTAVVAAIGVVIFAAVFLGIGLPALRGGIPEVTLPDLSVSGEPESGGENALPLAVTTETVQRVVATLSRPECYARTLSVTYCWGESGSASGTVQVWSDGDYVQTELTASNGEKQVRIVGEDTLYLWYDGDRTWRERPVEEDAGDLAQRIPTYEDVLSLEPEQITEAGYQSRNGHNCIYVQAQTGDDSLLERYWVETATGLLYGAETISQGKVVYSMGEKTCTVPMTEAHAFALPDGTVLHECSPVPVGE